MLETLKARFSTYTWELVADREMRSVYRLTQAGDPGLYIKLYHPGPAFQKLRNRFHPRTLREAQMLRRLAEAGFKVPEVVDHVQMGSESALITRAVDPCTLLITLPRGEQAPIMLETAARLLKKGFVHRDLHAGNVLLDRTHAPVLVDAYEVKNHARIRRADLIHTYAMVIANYEISDEQLQASLNEQGLPSPALIPAIRARAVQMNRARARRYVRRSLRPGSFSELVQTPEYKAILRRGVIIDLDATIRAHRKNIQEERHVLKCQAKTQVSLVGRWCVKSYQKAPLFTRPYAVRSWKGLLTLFFNALPVPDPVACVVFRDGSSLIITRAIDVPTLDKILFHEYATFPPAIRHGIPEHLGELIGRLHALGIYHADLKACNILADQQKLTFFLTDTDRVRQYPYLSQKRRIKNLLQIHLSIPKHVSRAFRMRFLKGYTKETREDAKVLFSEVWGLSRGMEIVYTTGMGDKFERWDQQCNSDEE